MKPNTHGIRTYKDQLSAYIKSRIEFEKEHQRLEKMTKEFRPILSEQSTYDLDKQLGVALDELLSSLVRVKSAKILFKQINPRYSYGDPTVYLHGSKEGLYKAHSQSSELNWSEIEKATGYEVKFYNQTIDFSILVDHNHIHQERIPLFVELVPRYTKWRKRFGDSNGRNLSIKKGDDKVVASIDDDTWTLGFKGADDISSSNVQDYEMGNAGWETKDIKHFVDHFEGSTNLLDELQVTKEALIIQGKELLSDIHKAAAGYRLLKKIKND